ncbi:WAP four-disulfide core domain protein 8-like isoform X2 [Nothobranchius furzeri]|uniref:WAP four-disulfide core domain protein 8-like isoform X2 n=1 Tax=Nothobranchius furzeri TaxID=105023 RepID=UPI003904C507
MRTHWSTIAALILGFCVVLSSNSIMPKPGNCPKDVPIMRPLLPLLPCDFDNDCPEYEKCCLFNHQRTCVSPVPMIVHLVKNAATTDVDTFACHMNW